MLLPHSFAVLQVITCSGGIIEENSDRVGQPLEELPMFVSHGLNDSKSFGRRYFEKFGATVCGKSKKTSPFSREYPGEGGPER